MEYQPSEDVQEEADSQEVSPKIVFGKKPQKRTYDAISIIASAFEQYKNQIKVAVRVILEDAFRGALMDAEGFEVKTLGDIIGLSWDNLAVFSKDGEKIIIAVRDSGQRCLITVEKPGGRVADQYYPDIEKVYVKGTVNSDGTNA